MSVATLLAYLAFDRQAIERLAADPWAVWVGLALVPSAGLARSFDTKDLRRQPWQLLLPFVAAGVLSLALHLAVSATLALKGSTPPPFLASYRSLLGLFLL